MYARGLEPIQSFPTYVNGGGGAQNWVAAFISEY